MSPYDKLRVKRRDLADTQARLQQLEAEIEALPGGPGYADAKTRLMEQANNHHRVANRLNGEIQFLTSELQPRLL